MKLYNKEFFNIAYSQNIANGINFTGKLEIANVAHYLILLTIPLSKMTTFIFKQSFAFLNDYSTAGFTTHQLLKANLNSRINFGNQRHCALTENLTSETTIFLQLCFWATKPLLLAKKTTSMILISCAPYDLSLSNKGDLGVN